MNFGALASKIGGTGKEIIRNGLVNKFLDITGNSAMTGQSRYAEYEYDANGHIKGVNSKYALEVENAYELLGVQGITQNDVDGNFGGLTTGKPRGALKDADLISRYPAKYDDPTYLYDKYKASEAKKSANSIQDSYKDRYAALEAREENVNKMWDNGEDYDAASAEWNAIQNERSALDAEVAKEIDSHPSNYGMLYNDVSTSEFNDFNKFGDQNKIANNPISDVYSIKLPDWTYADFINERAIWQKGLSSIFDEPGWFYFKIFFDFDTNHGLFGGLLNSKYLTNAVNSAAKYLYTIRRLHRYVKPQDRINALYKFASILSYINTNAPWYFKGITGLNKVANPIVSEFSKENSIELNVSPDAIDMRLSTLMSLYNYACFDSLTDREIIPSNLRKFNMSIILFQTPLRYLHTSYTTNEKQEFMGIDVTGLKNEVSGLLGNKKQNSSKVNYKSMSTVHGDTNNFADTMSMKIYTFHGCEFDKESFASIIPGQVSNETPFQLGNSSIKITYTSVTEHTMNEFYGMMWGADGFYFNQYSNYQLSLSDGTKWNGYVQREKDSWNKQKDRYKALADTFDDISRGGTILGLIDKPKTYKKAVDATEAIMNGMFDNPGLLKGLASNFALGLLGSSKNMQAPQGNLYGDYDINSAYFKDKLEMLKNGVHERTTAPYYYDPETGAKVQYHRNRTYSAYNFKNDVETIKNFNVVNWLQTNTQKFASSLNSKIRGLESVVHKDNIFTTAPYTPNQYNSQTAQMTDEKRFEGIGKNHDMVDDPTTWENVREPYRFNVPKINN